MWYEASRSEQTPARRLRELEREHTEQFSGEWEQFCPAGR